MSESIVPAVQPPIAIGGVGGSGTRIIARLLMDCGCYLGDDLNKANDNLWFSLLFRHETILAASDGEFDKLTTLFVKSMRGATPFDAADRERVLALAREPRSDLSVDWLRQRADSLLAAESRDIPQTRWGWKEPNTHIVIDRLLRTIPSLKYVHVVRSGVDMAYSGNQNQLRLWGRHYLGREVPVSPRWSLRFWHLANRRVARLFERLPTQLLWLNFDRLCADPGLEIERLLKFADLHVSDLRLDQLKRLPRRPDSVGRFKRHSLDDFDPEDLEYVRHLGFDTQIP